MNGLHGNLPEMNCISDKYCRDAGEPKKPAAGFDVLTPHINERSKESHNGNENDKIKKYCLAKVAVYINRYVPGKRNGDKNDK